MAQDAENSRPPDDLALRWCPDPVDRKKAFITRQITAAHCEKLQAEGFHACGNCVNAKPETLARWRVAMDSLLGQAPLHPVTSFSSTKDPFGLELRAARSWADLEEAYCLIHRTFYAEGLPENGPAQLRLNAFNRLPGARTFMIYRQGTLIGAITVLPDSVLGLPTDELYHAELKALRESGHRPCDFSSLAVEAEEGPLARAVRLHLFRAAWRYAREALQASDICALVPAHHERYYRKLFMFERLGAQRVYALGGSHYQAMGLRLDLEKAPEYFQTAYGHLKGEQNLHDFFVHQDVRALNAFLKKVKKQEVIGQIGGPGQPTFIISRRFPMGRP